MKQTAAHQGHNVDLLHVIPLTAKKVVEVGCGVGALAAAYRQLNPDAEYWGVEIEPEYAALAQAHCHRALAMNIEQAPDSFWDDAWDVDCWVFGDTLEHLTDPWQILARIRVNMPVDGSVVVCLPNMQHWSVIQRLLTGELHYEPAGLLDRTHLRWFTPNTMFKLFSDTGFRVETMAARVFDEPARAAALEHLVPTAKAFGLAAHDAAAYMSALQYVIKAVPADC